MAHNSTIVRFINIAARLTSLISTGLAARFLERLFLTPTRWPRPQRELRWMAGASQSKLRFDDSRHISLLTWGEGPTVLLAHGWSGRGSQMGAFVSGLVAGGFRVVAFDAPGHGDSDGRLTGLPEIAEAIQKIAKQEGPIHAVVAHSLGTAATTLALSRGLIVDRLVYISPPEDPGAFLFRAARFLGFSDAAARLARERIQRRFKASFDEARGKVLAPAMTADLLVIHDLDDEEIQHQEGALLAEVWPGAALVTTHGLGHHRIVRAPEVVELTVGMITVKDRQAWDRISAA